MRSDAGMALYFGSHVLATFIEQPYLSLTAVFAVLSASGRAIFAVLRWVSLFHAEALTSELIIAKSYFRLASGGDR
jgi:hypothetical protein